MIDISFLKHLEKFSLIVRKKITSNYRGERPTQFTGRGLLFKDHSIYTPGDDFRTIDWRIFARTDKLFVRRYEEERNLTVHIIVDFSGSMHFGTKKFKKSDFASMLGIGFAYMALKNNEKFVLSTFAEKLELFRPKKGMEQIASIVDYLNKKKAEGKTNFEESLAKYKKARVHSKSLVVIISDFLYDINQIKSTIYRFRNHQLKLVQVLDPIEVGLELEGDFKLKDAETNETMRTFISPYLRTKYHEMLSNHNAQIQECCIEVGSQFFSFPTDYPVFDAFYYLFG